MWKGEISNLIMHGRDLWFPLNMEEVHHLHRELLRFGVLIAQQVGEGSGKEKGGNGDEAPSLPEVRPDEELLKKRAKGGVISDEIEASFKLFYI